MVFTAVATMGVWQPADVTAGPQERIRVKIGIQVRTGDQVQRAKSRDRCRTSDLLRVQVHPKHPA